MKLRRGAAGRRKGRGRTGDTHPATVIPTNGAFKKLNVVQFPLLYHHTSHPAAVIPAHGAFQKPQFRGTDRGFHNKPNPRPSFPRTRESSNTNGLRQSCISGFPFSRE